MVKPPPLPDRIETDAEYDGILERLREGAHMIATLQLNGEDTGSKMVVYDRIEKLVREYRLRG